VEYPTGSTWLERVEVLVVDGAGAPCVGGGAVAVAVGIAVGIALGCGGGGGMLDGQERGG